MALTPTPTQDWGQRVQQRTLDQPAEIEPLWMDQLNQNMLLTVQAFQRMHAALDGRFTR